MPNTITEQETTPLRLGATVTPGATTFCVWAPKHSALAVEVVGKGRFSLEKQERGYFAAEIEGITIGDRYFYVLENGSQRPDPVSRSQPEGVHGPTEIICPQSYEWHDQNWEGLPLSDLIFYEIHVGTFTPAGTFEAIIRKLDYLKRLGITCIELMPLAQFPGRWNWGYDGASLYAPHSGYGGPAGLKRLVDACHQEEIAVCLDVVYNHLGPEGNYLPEFGPYLSDTYHTPWGKALNYDGSNSDEVRRYVIENALYWIEEFHIDGLRLDAIHGIYDFSASEMLPELIEAVEGKAHIIAESDRNDARSLRPPEQGGWDLSALWNDDFHHALHVTLTGEKSTYYQDYQGLTDLAKALRSHFVYDGQYSNFRKRRHGNKASDLGSSHFVCFSQNHDQIGNRPFGDRLSTLVPLEKLQMAATLTLLTPATPLLFMGEEYGETHPFEYFVDFRDEKLMRSIFEGRKREFHKDDMPFPGRESFDNSKLSWQTNEELFSFYQKLITLRKKHRATGEPPQVYLEDNLLAWEYRTEQGHLGVILNFDSKDKKSPLRYAQEALLQTSSNSILVLASLE